MVQDILIMFDELQSSRKLAEVMVAYNEHRGRASFSPRIKRVLPADRAWFDRLRRRTWPGRSLPQFTMQPDQLLSSLMRQYLFVEIYRAIAESLASENAARLMAMQGAQRNVEERLEDLTAQFHRQRQMSITSELLDVIGGFQALEHEKGFM